MARPKSLFARQYPQRLDICSAHRGPPLKTAEIFLLQMCHRHVKILETLPPKQFRQVVNKIFALVTDPAPSDSKQLSGFPYRRTDAGEYRIIYRVEADVVKIALVGKRNDDEVHREVERLQ